MKKRHLLLEYLLAAVLTAFALSIDSAELKPDLCPGLKALGKSPTAAQTKRETEQCGASK